jgi:hypothetical protein
MEMIMNTAINVADRELNEAELDAVSGGVPTDGAWNHWWDQFICYSCTQTIQHETVHASQ